MLVDKTNFGLMLYNHANFYRFGETSNYWSVKRKAVFLCYSLINLRHTPGITVYNRTVTNIENTVPCIAAIAGIFAYFSCYLLVIECKMCNVMVNKTFSEQIR